MQKDYLFNVIIPCIYTIIKERKILNDDMRYDYEENIIEFFRKLRVSPMAQ
jgi:hypothetical protein